MAEVTLRLRYNPKTGQRELVVSYESEADALPHEHERDHRAVAEALLGVSLDDARVVVERVGKGEAPPAEPAAEAVDARVPQAEKRG
ncbi:MAG: hypothetical protein HY909_05200 [Deltaproteobacteria bacterium]|nr:hypothetical protein [Deltaproteobacteria bacterium]